MDYALAFEKLGRAGAKNASTWESCVATWVDDGKGPMPTEAQCSAALVEVDDLTAQIASYNDALNSGFTDPILGVKLKTTKHAQEMFTALVTGLQEGLSLGRISNDTQIVIWNYTDEPVTLTVIQARNLLFNYFLHCKAFFDDYAP